MYLIDVIIGSGSKIFISTRRYIMVMKVSDPSGEAWLSVFNDQAEQIIGSTADELERIKSEVI